MSEYQQCSSVALWTDADSSKAAREKSPANRMSRFLSFNCMHTYSNIRTAKLVFSCRCLGCQLITCKRAQGRSS